MDEAVKNTDKELWRERDGDYYADSIHVTEHSDISINCGGTVIVKPIREWHKLAMAEHPYKPLEQPLVINTIRGAVSIAENKSSKTSGS